MVPPFYSTPLIPADDEPPTFWEKLKQLWGQFKQTWNAFWNRLTGKTITSPAAPTATLPPPQVTIIHAPTPTPTLTPVPTATPIPYQQYKTTGPLTEWESRVGGPVAHNAHLLLAHANQFYFWSDSDPGQNSDPPVPLNYDNRLPISLDPAAYQHSWYGAQDVYKYTGGRIPFVCGDVPDWSYFMAGYNLPQIFPEIAAKNKYPNRWTRSAYGYLTLLPQAGGTLDIFDVGSGSSFSNTPELGDVMIVQTNSNWGIVWDGESNTGAEHVVLVSEVHGQTFDKVLIIEGNPVDGTIVQHTVQELLDRVPNTKYLIYGHPALP
jgi:hypothetical protein